jgi:hypothetical protein
LFGLLHITLVFTVDDLLKEQMCFFTVAMLLAKMNLSIISLAANLRGWVKVCTLQLSYIKDIAHGSTSA